MTVRIIVLLFIGSWFLFGCKDKVEEEKPKIGYHPKNEINHSQQYHYRQAAEHLKEIKRTNRESHLNIEDFNRHLAAGEFSLDTFSVTQEDLDEWMMKSYKEAARMDLIDLRSMKLDGAYHKTINDIRLYAKNSDLLLEDFGTTESELNDLVISNIKSQARRMLAELRRLSNEELREIDVADYTERIRTLAADIEESVEIFGTSELELESFEYISIGE